jgi:hypothetical protein
MSGNREPFVKTTAFLKAFALGREDRQAFGFPQEDCPDNIGGEVSLRA